MKLKYFITSAALALTLVLGIGVNSVLASTTELSKSEIQKMVKGFDLEKEEAKYQQKMEKVQKKLKQQDIKPFEKLSEQDILGLEKFIEDTKSQNPNMAEKELNKIIRDKMKEVEKQPDLQGISFYGYTLNGDEAALCALNPIDCSNVYEAKNTAESATYNYYSSGFHNGNADAFRHAVWNKEMENSIGYSQAKAFADAHEYGNDSQPYLEQVMDLYNNDKGRDYSYKSNSNMATSVDNGSMRRIVQGRLVASNDYGRK
ncbi:DUF6973 domain-containing protein [Halobacillus salinus]|uniref:DUF6973 domain-containing protein n=1 Tax=Halobacillus salinus TaxID=192814 RepID=UPI0009A7B21F|nr:hypothetical protein [Halobacillus salinus]